MKRRNRKTVFFERKIERDSVRRIVKKHYQGKSLYYQEQRLLFAHGYNQSMDISFYDQDMDNIVKNLITVVVDFRLIRCGRVSITIQKIIADLFKYDDYPRTRSRRWGRLPKEMIEDVDGFNSFIKNHIAK